MQFYLRPTRIKVVLTIILTLFFLPMFFSQQVDWLIDGDSILGGIVVLWWIASWWISLVLVFPSQSLFEKWHLLIHGNGFMGFGLPYLTPFGTAVIVLFYTIMLYLLISLWQGQRRH